MTICVRIKGKKREPCIDDLDRIVTLKNRSITPPKGGSVDFTEVFSDLEINEDDLVGGSFSNAFSNSFQVSDQGLQDGEVWAMIESLSSAATIFDEVNQEQAISHKLLVYFVAGVTAETWVEFEDQRFDVVKAEDLDLRHEWIMLYCNLRGSSVKSTTAL